MSNYTEHQIRQVVLQSAIYCSAVDQQTIRIDHTEHNYFHGTDDANGDSCTVYFEDIDLDNDIFYKFVQLDIKTVL